jgi:hypothetical protein
LKRCWYYYDLEEVMGDRSGTGPKASTYHNLQDNYDSDINTENDRVELMMARRKRDDEDEEDNENNDKDDDYVDNN